MSWVRRRSSSTRRFAGSGSAVDWLIVGLGNPGPEYDRSPHNIGFAVVDELARRHRIGLHAKHKGLYGQGEVGECPIVLLKPLTFMNLSGESVRPAQKQLNVTPERVLVVHDELDLSFGTVRLKQGGGLAGHNGLKSINAFLKTPEFPRVRVGIGRPAADDRRPIRDWILRPMDGSAPYDELAALGADAVEDVLRGGVASAMNTVNARPGLQ